MFMLFVIVFAVQYIEYLVFGFKLALIPALLFFFSDGVIDRVCFCAMVLIIVFVC